MTNESKPFPRLKDNTEQAPRLNGNQDFTEALGIIFSGTDSEMRKSNLSRRQMRAIARLHVFAEKHDSNNARQIRDALLALPVSHKGLGLNLVRDVILAVLDRPNEEQQQRRGFFSKFF